MYSRESEMVGSSQKNSVLDTLHRSGSVHECKKSEDKEFRQRAEYKEYMYSLSRNAKCANMANRLANKERYGEYTDDDGYGSVYGHSHVHKLSYGLFTGTGLD